MINDAKNTMVGGAPNEKQTFHFSGDGVHWPKAIVAASIEEAEKIWHSVKRPIVKSSSAPVVSPPAIPAAPTESKVEDKPTNIE